MKDNRNLLRRLFAQNLIALENSPLFEASLSQEGRVASWDRVEGMLLGVAIGDSLGNTSESMGPSERRRWYGTIRDYLPNRHANDQCVGLPSDDTQMTFWTLEQLLNDDGLEPGHLAAAFSTRRIFGIGSTVKEFLRRYKDSGIPWERAGVGRAGNGALMRISPILVPHLRAPSAAMWADAALAGMITHNDRGSNATCVAFTAMLWDLLHMDSPPDKGWWTDRYCEIASSLEGDACYTSRHKNPEYRHAGPLWHFIRDKVRPTLERGLSVREACNAWHSGAFLLETLPCALYILASHGEDPEEAVVCAVNDTRDNDTIASIVGAAIGALHGAGAWPRRWREGLLGRTAQSDDGRVFELIDEARDRFAA